jgi:hypothetical protein
MADNSHKIILDLCGGTGAWSKPYRQAGYDVRVITIPEHDVRCYTPPPAYGILAAPPCTEFSLAKGGRPRDFYKGMEIVEACLGIIWRVRYFSDNHREPLRFWCMENPCGFLRQFLGKPPHVFEQWQFGEMLVKKTDLWGYFNMPKPTVKEKPKLGMMRVYPNGKSNAHCWAKPERPDWLKDKNLTRQDLRAITPPGFATAFFKANP